MRLEVTTFKTRVSRRSFLSHACALAAFTALGGFGFARPGLAAHSGDESGDAAPVAIMTPDVAYEAAQAGEIFLIDIRRPDEWLETRVGEGAIGLDMRDESFVPALVALRQANPDKPIALICRTGSRSAYVTGALAKQGFTGLVDVSEGMVGGVNGQGWLKRGLPTYSGDFATVVQRRLPVLP